MKRIIDRQAKQDAINKKCELLMELGFEIGHEDSDVGLSGIDFDFSGTAGDVKSIILTAINQAYAQGQKQGVKSMRASLKEFIFGDDE